MSDVLYSKHKHVLVVLYSAWCTFSVACTVRVARDILFVVCCLTHELEYAPRYCVMARDRSGDSALKNILTPD